MAKYTINQLPTKTVVGTDEIELQTTSGGLSGKTTVNDLKTYISDTPTFTGVVSVPDGSVSAPSITNTGDTNTGIYFGAADTMSVAAGGAEVAYFANGITKAVFRVDVADQYSHTYSQNLTASGSTAGAGFVCAAGSPTKLGSISMAADGRMDLFNQANGAITFGTNATERMRIDATGAVGIGVSPQAILHVYNAADARARVSDGTTATDIVSGSGVGSVGTTTSHPLAFLTANTERARIDTDGYALIGYTSSNGAYKLQVNSQIFATNATVATSDVRYKENIKSVDNGLELVNALRPVSFTWKPQEDIKASVDVKEKAKNEKDEDILVTVGREDVVKREKHAFDSGVHIGFIAQEVKAALQGQAYVDSIVKLNGRPPVLDADGNVVAPAEEFYGLAHVELIALLVKAVQELSAKVTTLEAKVK